MASGQNSSTPPRSPGRAPSRRTSPGTIPAGRTGPRGRRGGNARRCCRRRWRRAAELRISGDAVIDRVRHEVNERDKEAERADEAGGIKPDESAADRLADIGARGLRRRSFRRATSPSGPRPWRRGLSSMNKASPAPTTSARPRASDRPRASRTPIREAANGGTTSVPTPIPLTASPRRSRGVKNQRCTAPTAGT